MYQVSCFYHKMHDSSQNCYISAPLLGVIKIFDDTNDIIESWSSLFLVTIDKHLPFNSVVLNVIIRNGLMEK